MSLLQRLCKQLLSRTPNQKGFSLIELLAVIAIVATMSSISFAAFSSYSDTQTVKGATNDVTTLLQTAKSRAQSQVKPDQCGNLSLQYYKVVINIPERTYRLDVQCGGNTSAIETKQLPAQVTFGSGSTTEIAFGLLSGGVLSSGTIIVTGYGKTQTITVTATGAISVQ